MSSMTSRTGRSSPASSAISLRTRPEPSKCGDGASGVRTASDPTAARSCSSTESLPAGEALGVLLVAPNRDPRRTAGEVRFVDPRVQQHRLPAAGRRRDERDAACEPGGQALEEFRPCDNGQKRYVPRVIEDPLTLRIVSRRNSPRKSERPRKAASRATVVAIATFAAPATPRSCPHLADRYDVGGHRSSGWDDAGSSAQTRRSRHARSSGRMHGTRSASAGSWVERSPVPFRAS